MADVTVRSDSVDVEQIMRQIRQRIREKRGADYTQAELQQLASAKLEKFADPSGLRSDLLEEFRKKGDEPSTYHRHRGMRRLLLMMAHPILKRVQKQLMADLNLYFEIIHNLVIETTRLGIENHNLKMKVESLSSRLDFDERRAKALEGVVQYRRDALPRQRQQQHTSAGASGSPGTANASSAAGSQGSAGAGATGAGSAGSASSAPTPAVQVQSQAAAPASGQANGGGQPQPGDGERKRRRRRRRRRPGMTLADSPNAAGVAGAAGAAAMNGDDDGPDDGGPDDEGDDGSDGGAAGQ